MTPADIIARALDVACGVGSPNGLPAFDGKERDLMELGLRRLSAAGYRILGPEETDEATAVYGRLLHRHMDAARKDFGGERRKKLFELVEDFRAEFPDECQVWEDRYDPELRSIASSEPR